MYWPPPAASAAAASRSARFDPNRCTIAAGDTPGVLRDVGQRQSGRAQSSDGAERRHQDVLVAGAVAVAGSSAGDYKRPFTITLIMNGYSVIVVAHRRQTCDAYATAWR